MGNEHDIDEAGRQGPAEGSPGAGVAPTLHRPVAAIAESGTAATATLQRSGGNAAAAAAGTMPDVTQLKTRALTERRVPRLAESGPTQFRPGALVNGRFLLRERIGEGGMGIVFAAVDRRKTEARDPNPLVAIKIMNADVARHRGSFMALQREARKAQTLAHPNVATVFDFDRDGDTPYLCMELLQGRSLEAVLQEAGGAVAEGRALAILRDVAAGLANAHRNGIVHSDLKPGNIFLTDSGTAKILDFGIARAIPAPDAAGSAHDLFDARSLYACTEAYATAEMMRGGQPHPADDIYALSLIAYQLFTGKHPFQRYNAAKAAELGLAAARPKGMRRHHWRTLQAGLSFDRERRPADAAEFSARFFPLQTHRRALIAAALLIALTAGYAGYQDYAAGGPAVPFDRLPVQTRDEFRSVMRDGDRLWQFYDRDGNFLALQEAMEQYARAYTLHPGNRQAVRALERGADAALARASSGQRGEVAQALARRSDYLAKYPPVLDAGR